MADPREGGKLTFTSGEGECEMHVCDTDGKPRCHVAELTGDVCLARLRARRQPLSMETLQEARERLEQCGELGEELGSCLDLALERFGRELPCVQGNATMMLSWAGGSLEFLSGEGGYTISVFYHKGNPRYYLHIKDLPGHLYVAWLRSRKERLSSNSLLALFTGLRLSQGETAALRACFHRAWEGFRREPRCVQENTRLLIRWDGQELEFVSGQGQCEISVLLADGEPQYHITELKGDRPVTWSHTSPESLSVTDIARVRDRLGCWGLLGKELSGCFEEAISQFSQEPPCMQENARLRLCWGTQSLEFLSGDGEYMFSVSYQEENPRYHFHIKTLPGHLYVARLCSHKDPLSADSLFKFHTDLGFCQGDTAVLRDCLYTAWEGFRREPRCVQENARLLIQGGGMELEFVSGQGQCEISVLLADGEPQYHITELKEDRPVIWSHSSSELLSVTDLERVRDRLREWGALGEELSSCFRVAISQFSQEPRFVQENARLLIQWGEGELEFISGQGQCEISVLLANGEPQYHTTELGWDRPMTWSHGSPEPLSIADLERMRDRLGHWGALRKGLRDSFGEAISQFRREPRCVQENARLLIQWGGGELEFVSGQGQCEISVLLTDGEPQYLITKVAGDRPVTWSHASPEALSVTDLARVRDRLEEWGALGEELSSCFGEAISQFSQEPRCVQENARMLIQWGGGELEFISGQGQCEIFLHYGEGKPQYNIGELPVHMYLARLRAHPDPLSTDILWRVWRKLGSCQEDTSTLRACISHALNRFVQEPWCVQENTRLLIRWSGGELEFISGHGQCEILVLFAGGEPQYHITELGGDRPVTWSHTSPDPLSIADLARVRDRLGHWGVLSEELRSCFGEAISRFNREPPWVQGNARMRIYWDRNRLEFLSGEGQCKISVRYRNRKAQYKVGELPVHINLARLHTLSEPEHQPPVTPHD